MDAQSTTGVESPLISFQSPAPKSASKGYGKPPLSACKQYLDEDRSSIHSPIMGSPGMMGSSGQENRTTVCTPRDNNNGGINNSPFREWATCNLSSFGNDLVSPSNASRGLLSPSFSHLRKIEHSPLAAREEVDISANLQEQTSPMLSLNNVFKVNAIVALADPVGAQIKSEKPADVRQVVDMQDARRIPRLKMTEEFSFQLFEHQVKVKGFKDPVIESTGSTTRAKRPAVPSTPGFQGYDSAQTRLNMDPNDGKRRVCCCKKSRCLKLYCECFSAGVLCSVCKCVDCANNGHAEDQRLQAVDGIKQRNINAFAPKIVEDASLQAIAEDKSRHARGCRCKKSHCLKKYCECFQAGVECTDKCRCEDCQNTGDYDGTPRDRPESSGRTRTLQSSASSEPSVDDDERGGHEGVSSPSPSKKPRMLDFNVLSTPSLNTKAMLEMSPMEGVRTLLMQ